MSKDHSGVITLYRVPRRFVVSLLVALLLVGLHVLDYASVIDETEAVVMVERGLAIVVALASLFGWHGLASWLRDPNRSTVD